MADSPPPVTAEDLARARQALGLPPGDAVPPGTVHVKQIVWLDLLTANGDLLLTVWPDGTVQLGHGLEDLDDAGRLFWQAVARNYRP
jgi:hypothetical protein